MKNFGTKANRKPEPNYLFSAYLYYDWVREKGLGIQYQFMPQFSVDVSAYVVTPNTYFKDKILQWDYYDLKGYGICIKPKRHFNLLRTWYISPNIAFEWLNHGKTWVEHMVAYHEIVHYLQETKGTAYTIGYTLGTKITFDRLNIEPFIGIGSTTFKGKIITYDLDNKKINPSESYPKETRYNQDYFQMNIGVKLGLNFKPNKKHKEIDKKFDEVYLPKSDSLKTFFKSISKEQMELNKNHKMAYYRYKKLNSSSLRRYRKYYNDTTQFYQKMDDLFIQIEKLINYGLPTAE